MKLQQILIDIVDNCSIGKVEVMKAEPKSDHTVHFKANDEERLFFIDVHTKIPTPEFTDVFGLFNFKVLKGLLDMDSFKSDNAEVKVQNRKDGSPDLISFKAKGASATYRLMNKDIIPEHADIKDIPWDITFKLSGNKITEFQKMSNLYKIVDENFALRYEDGNVIVDFGTQSSSTHSGSMVLVENVDGRFAGSMYFKIENFLNMLKAGAGIGEYEISVMGRGLLGIIAENDIANYNFYLKKKMV